MSPLSEREKRYIAEQTRAGISRRVLKENLANNLGWKPDEINSFETKLALNNGYQEFNTQEQHLEFVYRGYKPREIGPEGYTGVHGNGIR